MDELLIAAGAEEDYTASLRWYAERSTRAAEGFESEFAQALKAIAAILIGIPCAMIGIDSICSSGIRFKSSTVRHPRIDG